MNKIGILTFPNSPSYGASLQMFALYECIKRNGFEVEEINYINDFMREKKHIYSGFAGRIKKTASEIVNIRRNVQFRDFEKRLDLYPQKIIHTHEDLLTIGDRYTAVICGSDQVWNPYVTGGDLAYFFDFCSPEVKKISYAPSFGIEMIPLEYKIQYADAILKFDHLSVREETGYKIIKELTGRESTVVVDPSMLLFKHEWEKVVKPVSHLPDRYIAKFVFNVDADTEKFCEKESRKRSLPIVNIGKTGFSRSRYELYSGPIGPEEWLYCIKNADCVITDSFHGLAFSIIFQKDLYLSLASKTKTRLEMLSKTYGLEDRIIGSPTISDKALDFGHINEVMSVRRMKSLDFLKTSLLL